MLTNLQNDDADQLLLDSMTKKKGSHSEYTGCLLAQRARCLQRQVRSPRCTRILSPSFFHSFPFLVFYPPLSFAQCLYHRHWVSLHHGHPASSALRQSVPSLSYSLPSTYRSTVLKSPLFFPTNGTNSTQSNNVLHIHVRNHLLQPTKLWSFSSFACSAVTQTPQTTGARTSRRQGSRRVACCVSARRQRADGSPRNCHERRCPLLGDDACSPGKHGKGQVEVTSKLEMLPGIGIRITC